jgi:PAS domain S-box-containing protein
VAAEAKTALANRTENLLNTVMGNLGEAVIFVEPPKRVIVGCNSAVEQMLGYSEKELIGKSTALLHVNVDTFETFGTISESVLTDQGIFRYEWDLKHKDGHPVPVEVTVVALQEDLGWRAGVVSIIRDLTSQKKAEDDLCESEQMYRLLAENTLDIIWEMDSELVFTYVNPAIEKVTGHSPSEFVGTHLREHVVPDELKKLQDVIHDEISRGSDGEGVVVEMDILRKDKALVAAEIHGRVIFGDDGTPVAIQGTTCS